MFKYPLASDVVFPFDYVSSTWDMYCTVCIYIYILVALGKIGFILIYQKALKLKLKNDITKIVLLYSNFFIQVCCLLKTNIIQRKRIK